MPRVWRYYVLVLGAQKHRPPAKRAVGHDKVLVPAHDPHCPHLVWVVHKLGPRKHRLLSAPCNVVRANDHLGACAQQQLHFLDCASVVGIVQVVECAIVGCQVVSATHMHDKRTLRRALVQEFPIMGTKLCIHRLGDAKHAAQLVAVLVKILPRLAQALDVGNVMGNRFMLDDMTPLPRNRAFFV